MTPLLLAAVGGLFTEKAGMLNIGLEGLMLVGSFFSVLAAGSSGSLALGILAGVSSSMLLALLFGLSCLKLKANLFIAGIATNLMGAGLTSLLASFFFGHKGVHRFPVFPELLKISPPVWSGVLGEILLGHSGLVYAGWAAVIIAYIILNKTVLGLRLKGTGFDNRTVKSLGLNPDFYRLLAFLISGFCCGLAGTFLSFNLEAFVPNGTAGRGWIALVIIYLGCRKPGGILLAAILFALAESLSNHLQGVLSIPNRLILALPYIISILALIIYSVWGHYRKRLY
jgi:simple sugar transport system permease protein